MDTSGKKRRLGNIGSLPAAYDKADDNPTLVGNGPGAVASMAKAMADTNKRDYIKAIVPAFVESG